MNINKRSPAKLNVQFHNFYMLFAIVVCCLLKYIFSLLQFIFSIGIC